ncbi:hypothetical protein GGR56DRAFT_625203 [Xylariaceae sp. FL0804]|nr:hypothetical protein GGR56DRAFT_625203 [Xylariaceae sp. FL0804]
MAASRRGQPELHVRLPSSPGAAAASSLLSGAAPSSDLPPISALFLIDFDVKAGYTITWKAARPGLELEGVVEYKSLPSGLHTVSEDLIYFVHDGHAGLSAFVNAPVQDTAARNARMLAVGVLVPLSYGRLGRAWRHAEALKHLASTLAADSQETAGLQQYWEKHQARDPVVQDPSVAPETLESPSVTFQTQSPRTPRRGHTRIRSASDGASLMPPGHKLSPFHPAWSLTRVLDTFGPLIFPIQRAALLRKRILILGHAPVQEACNFVYDISILSNIPLSTYAILSSNSPPHRLRPLFSIGVHDIPFLMDDAKLTHRSTDATGEQQEMGSGWIACTTDSILSKKDTLWDMLITLPPSQTSNAARHIWPAVECPQGVPVKATQRDLRRFRSLKAGLSRIRAAAESAGTSPTSPRPPKPPADDDQYLDDAEQIVEPVSWAALAYSGFMWWASAGEQARSDQAEEFAQDSALLVELSSPNSSMIMPRAADLAASASSLTPRRASSGVVSAPLEQDEARVELAAIAYFHRLTNQVFGTLADIVESMSDDDYDDDDDAGDDDSPMGGEEEDDALLDPDEREPPGRRVRIGADAMKRMGLDMWSAADAEFVRHALRAYFDLKVQFEGKGVEVCGVRVC